MKISIRDTWDEYAQYDIFNPNHGVSEHSTRKFTEKWETKEVTFDELKEYIEKGYSIKINC